MDNDNEDRGILNNPRLDIREPPQQYFTGIKDDIVLTPTPEHSIHDEEENNEDSEESDKDNEESDKDSEENNVNSEEDNENIEILALDYMVQKLYEQFQMGHYGCLLEQY